MIDHRARVEETRRRAAADLERLPRWRKRRRRQNERLVELCDKILASGRSK